MKKYGPIYVLIFILFINILGCYKSSSLSSFNLKKRSSAKTLIGRASWYGPRFHGRKTANGETYNMYGLTAAHKTLPFGSILKVTNLSNNRELYVRVNDRGPFIAGRDLDLSYTAARRLDMVEMGVARVKIEVFKPWEILPNVVALNSKISYQN